MKAARLYSGLRLHCKMGRAELSVRCSPLSIYNTRMGLRHRSFDGEGLAGWLRHPLEWWYSDAIKAKKAYLAVTYSYAIYGC